MMYKVLIIDDDGLDIFMHTKVMKVFNFSKEVVSLKSGIKALAYLNSSGNDTANLPDIIFLDLAMPIMGGREFLKAYENLPVAITSYCKVVALSEAEDIAALSSILRHAHVFDVVPKPLNGQTLKILDSKVTMARETMG